MTYATGRAVVETLDKQWDLLVVRNGQLLVAIEAKSQSGEEFGNNFNNRTEEAMGSALDLWTAYREGAFDKERPGRGSAICTCWKNCAASPRPVNVAEPHFQVFPEFKEASYAQRYELFCRGLARERHYDGTAFLMAEAESGKKGEFSEPAEDLTFARLAGSLGAHVSANWSQI